MKRFKLAAWMLSLVLAAGIFAGCRKEDNAETEPSESGTEAYSYDFSKGLTELGYIEGVTARDYIKIDAKDIVIPASKLQESVDEYLASFWDYIGGSFPTEVTDRAIKDGDKVNIDYAGFMDGVQFENGTAENQEVTAGSSQFIDDFLTQIIGHKAGDNFDVEVTFPDPYPNNPDFAGKDATFNVTINFIAEPAEINDEFVKEHIDDIVSVLKDTGMENFTTKAEVDEYLSEQERKKALQTEITNLIAKMELEKEAPDAAYRYAYDFTDYTYYSNYGMHFKDILNAEYLKEEEIEEIVRGQMVLELACQSIGEDLGIEIPEEDFYKVTGETDNSKYIERYGKAYIARNGMKNKTLEWLIENVTVSEE